MSGDSRSLQERIAAVDAELDALPDPDDGHKRQKAGVRLHGDLRRIYHDWHALPDDHPEKADLQRAIHKSTRCLLDLAFGVDPRRPDGER